MLQSQETGLLAGVSKLGIIRNNIKIHNIFRERSCHKYTADLPETGIYL